jgi:hypothetical protein
MNLTEAINNVRPCVVQIRSNLRVLGTGFFVSEDAHVVTANHVIASVDPAQITVGVASANIDTPRYGPEEILRYWSQNCWTRMLTMTWLFLD